MAFYDDDNTPTNSHGYLTFVDQPFFVEPGTSTTWSGALSVSVLRDPDLSASVPKGQTNPVITADVPWDRTTRTHVTGSATIGLKQNLGSRADFEAEITARNGDFGGNPGSVQSSKYVTNVYADYGATLTGGRFDVAAPSNAIAFAESGDAVGLGARLGHTPLFASATYVFKKELAEGSFTVDEVKKAIQSGAAFLDRNNRDLVLQLRDIAAGPVRASLYTVIGDADRGRLPDQETQDARPVEFDANYWTTGTEIIVTRRQTIATLGVYHSERSSNAAPAQAVAGDNASGNVGLASVAYTNLDHDGFGGDRQGTDISITGQIGRGTGYVGEGQRFAPDALFLAKFAGALVDPEAPIGAGLANKWYYGLVATTPKVDWLGLGRGAATLRLHHYELVKKRDRSSNLGTEASLEVRIEQPKGVRYQAVVAAFWPGGALNTADESRRLITKPQYLIRFGVTVRIE